MLNGVLPNVRVLVILFNLANYVLMSVMAYEWFLFMAASERMPFRKSRRKRTLCLLPLLVSTLAMVIAYVSAPYFWISESGELNRWYYPMLIAAPSLYLFISFAFSAVNARKAEYREEKTLYWLIGIFPLGIMAFGLIQVVSLNVPTFCFGCTVMLVFFYIQNMQALISVDALTQLNNRGQINRYMERLHPRANTRVYILMIDIDHFKQINDAYGHAEGDRALVLVSEALKQTSERFKGSVFLGRYGGDEFTVILQSPEEAENPEQAARVIRAALSEKQRINRLPYALNVSIGYDELRDRSDTMQACMIRADEKLYAEKRTKE